jgi:hypothetical protein
MTTLTEEIYFELTEGPPGPDELDEIMKKYGHSKGPLYLALGKATETLQGKLKTVFQQCLERSQENQHQAQVSEDLQKENADLDLEISSKGKELSSLEGEIESSKPLLNQAEKLKKLGFGPVELQHLQEMLVEVSELVGSKSEKAVQTFFGQVEIYAKLMGLQSELKATQVAGGTAKAKAQHWQAEANAAEAKSKVRLTSIKLIEKLLAEGIKEGDLPVWSAILSKSSVAPEELEKSLEKYSGLEKLCQDRTICSKKLESQVQNLTSQVKALMAEREQIAAAIEDLRKTALAEMDALSQETLTAIKTLGKNSGQAVESIREKTVIEVDSVSKTALANIQALVDKSAEYVALERQVAKLAEELALARAIRTQNPADWKDVSRQSVRGFLNGILIWSRLDVSRNPRMSPPTNSLSYKLSYFDWTPATLDEVLEWALAGTYTEQERNMLVSHSFLR